MNTIIEYARPGEPMPDFFLFRIFGWLFFSLLAFICGIVLTITKFTADLMVLSMPFIIGLASLGMGIGMFLTARRRKYFMICFACLSVEPVRALSKEGSLNMVNPFSPNAFKRIKRIVLQAQDGQQFTFTFEASRAFVEGKRYRFYFRIPDTEDIDLAALETLLIDYSLMPNTVENENAS